MSNDSLNTSKDEITFIPLGGAGHFGANFNLYGFDKCWIGLDCGMGFAGDRYPGIDLILPNTSFIEDHKDKLSAIVITHAHEDHIGGVCYLWPRLKCPIYTSHFTAEVLRRKLSETTYGDEVEIIEVEARKPFNIGPYELKFLPVSHSIPDTHAVQIKTPLGSILHSGDWNMDPTPMAGYPTDAKDFEPLKNENILSFVGDSTNAPFEKEITSESDLVAGFEEEIGKIKGRVLVTLFSSNIGRIKTVALAAEKHGRSVCLVGRSLKNMASIAQTCGFLEGIPPFVEEEDAGHLPNDKIVYLLTGSQGEYRAALPKISRGAHSEISLGEGDVVLFSARSIPGNECAINEMKNLLAAQGVKFVTPDDALLHVSGHPYRAEIKQMFDWVKPQSVVAVHGEREHQQALVDLAKSSQIHKAVVPQNGSVIKIAPGKLEIVDHVVTDFLLYDEVQLLPEDHISIHERRKMSYNGAAFASVIIDKESGDVRDIQFTCYGLLDDERKEDSQAVDELLDNIEAALQRLGVKSRKDEDVVHEEVRVTIRRFFRDKLIRKPLTDVHVSLV